MDIALLQNPLDAEILSLLLVSNLAAKEKEVWMAILPELPLADKEWLKKNLEKEVQYEITAREKAVTKLEHAFQKSV